MEESFGHKYGKLGITWGAYFAIGGGVISAIGAAAGVVFAGASAFLIGGIVCMIIGFLIYAFGDRALDALMGKLSSALSLFS